MLDIECFTYLNRCVALSDNSGGAWSTASFFWCIVSALVSSLKTFPWKLLEALLPSVLGRDLRLCASGRGVWIVPIPIPQLRPPLPPLSVGSNLANGHASTLPTFANSLHQGLFSLCVVPPSALPPSPGFHHILLSLPSPCYMLVSIVTSWSIPRLNSPPSPLRRPHLFLRQGAGVEPEPDRHLRDEPRRVHHPGYGRARTPRGPRRSPRPHAHHPHHALQHPGDGDGEQRHWLWRLYIWAR